MRLYEVPRNSRIRVNSNKDHPPAHRNFAAGEELTFSHIDGMYSLCYDKDGHPVHLSAMADVEVLK